VPDVASHGFKVGHEGGPMAITQGLR